MANKVRIYLDEPQIKLAQQLFRDGWSVDRVAAQVGVNKHVIWRYRRDGEDGFPPITKERYRGPRNQQNSRIVRIFDRTFVAGSIYKAKDNDVTRLFLGGHSYRGWVVFMDYHGKEVTVTSKSWAAWAGEEVRIGGKH